MVTTSASAFTHTFKHLVTSDRQTLCHKGSMFAHVHTFNTNAAIVLVRR